MARQRMEVVHHLDIMERLESIRFGLWYMLIQRGQGHLAHAVVGGGFKVLELMRRFPCPAGALDSEEASRWREVLNPYIATLQQVHQFLMVNKCAERTWSQVGRLCCELQNLGCVQGNTAQPPGWPHGKPPGPFSSEIPPCDTVNPLAAKKRSQDTSASVQNTSETSPSGNDASSTDCVTSEKPEQLITQTSVTELKSLSKGQNYKRGKGHPKRGNPYTKGGKKKR